MCEVIKIGNGTAIICRGNHESPICEHKCNEVASVYELRNGERIFIIDNDDQWFAENFKEVISGSVACSICRRAVIDNAPYL